MTRTSGHDEPGPVSRISADSPSRCHVAAVLLTPEEAAALGIGRTRLYQLLSSGRASLQLGRSRRIPVAAIHDFVARLDDSDVLSRRRHRFAPQTRPQGGSPGRRGQPRQLRSANEVQPPWRSSFRFSSPPMVHRYIGRPLRRRASPGTPAAKREPVGAPNERRGSHHPDG
jgi:excisionase family DNA binding protein